MIAEMMVMNMKNCFFKLYMHTSVRHGWGMHKYLIVQLYAQEELLPMPNNNKKSKKDYHQLVGTLFRK